MNFHADVFRRLGYEQAVDTIQELFLHGKQAEAVAAVPNAMVDEICLVGSKAKIKDDLAAWRESKVTTLLIGGPRRPSATSPSSSSAERVAGPHAHRPAARARRRGRPTAADSAHSPNVHVTKLQTILRPHQPSPNVHVTKLRDVRQTLSDHRVRIFT
jgi:hypothetical protein